MIVITMVEYTIEFSKMSYPESQKLFDTYNIASKTRVLFLSHVSPSPNIHKTSAENVGQHCSAPQRKQFAVKPD